jgi:hypothetical protein
MILSRRIINGIFIHGKQQGPDNQIDRTALSILITTDGGILL